MEEVFLQVSWRCCTLALLGCFSWAEMLYIAALEKMYSALPSFLEIGVLLLVHRLNPDVEVVVLVGEYMKLKLLGLIALVKGD